MTGRGGKQHDFGIRSGPFTREDRIRKRADYTRIYDDGRKIHGRFVVIFATVSESGRSRLGITVTKRVGRAHDRNKLKRRVREIFRKSLLRDELDGIALDVVVNLKPSSKDASYDDLENDLVGAVRKAKRHGGD